MREFGVVKAAVPPYVGPNSRCRGAASGRRHFIGQRLCCREIISKRLNSGRPCNMVNAVMAAPGAAQDAFDKYLQWLSPHRDVAIEKHEEVRKKIVRYFVHKHCEDPHELFGITLDRVVKLVNRPDGYADGIDPLRLFFGVARNVWLESLKRPVPDPLGERDLPAVDPTDGYQHEQRLQCLENCLDKLPESEREFIAAFYQGNGRERINRRKQLAAQKGGSNASRIRAFRIRGKLRVCVEDCLKRAAN